MNIQTSPVRMAQQKHRVIDCDIHPSLPSPAALLPHLDPRWHGHHKAYGSMLRAPFLNSPTYPKATPALSRRDSWPMSGGPPGSDLEFMRQQHLDANGIEYGILQPLSPAGKDQRDLDYAAALCRAMNDWQLAAWTEPEPRLRSSIMIPCEDAAAAVAEIDRCAANPAFAQILITSRTREPLGERRYWPIFSAAERHGLPIGIHVGGVSGFPLAPSGWPSFYIEDHYGHSIGMQSLLASLVFGGVFESFPGLRIVSVEAGIGWVPAFRWRLDSIWSRQRSELPHLPKRPSDYLSRNVWFTTQPIDEPDQRRDLLDIFTWVGFDRILFSTDYPHWDFDDPQYAIRANLTEAQKAMIFSGNARNVYRLP